MPKNTTTSKPQPIRNALGIQNGDLLTTSDNPEPRIVYQVHGPYTYFDNSEGIIILDHPEISLTLSTPGSKRQGGSFINNIRQENNRWYTAMNYEIFIQRPTTIERPAPTSSLFDIFDTPNTVEFLPIPAIYKLDPKVDYQAGPSRTWHCETCSVDFNTIRKHTRWAIHTCDSDSITKPIYYVRAPPPGDRRPHISYFLMTLNKTEYQPLPNYAARAAAPTSS